MSSGANNKSAAQLMAEANKKAKSANGIFQRMLGTGSGTNEDARELYIQAGNAGKAEGDYPMSVEAYKRALDLSTEDYEKAQMYEAISSSYKMFDLPQAVSPLTRAAELHMTQGKWTMASQILEKIAELYEQMNDYENMMKSLKEAYRFLKQEGQKQVQIEYKRKWLKHLYFKINLFKHNKNMKKWLRKQKMMECLNLLPKIIG